MDPKTLSEELIGERKSESGRVSRTDSTVIVKRFHV